MRLNHPLFFCTLLYLVANLLSASQTSREEETIDAILQAYIESQGGAERLQTITSLEVEGTMVLDSQGLDIPILQKLQAPDQAYTRQDFPGLGIIENRLDGNRGWEWHPIAGERPLAPLEVEELLDDTDFQRDLNLREEYQSIRLGAPEVIEGIQTSHLIMVDDRGREEHWYFKDNGDLFQKIHTISAGPESEFEATERYYDLEEDNGFRFPRRIRYLNPAYEAELTIIDLVINRKMDASVFELPYYAEEMESLSLGNQERSSTTVD